MLIWIDAVAQELLLFACFWMVIIGLDDLVFDLLWIGNAVRGRWRPLALHSLPEPPPTRLAIFVPLWQEADVVAPMIAHTLDQWAATRAGVAYRIYLGCYPNDAATCAVVKALTARHPDRLRMALNPHAGPTTKADNLNSIWQAMTADVAAEGHGFDAIILHDAEDMVHRDELSLYAAMLVNCDMVQIPVVPLTDPDSRWVSGHYADEFAEAHGKDMPLRDWLGAPLPSAGVGVALRTRLIERLAAESVRSLPFDPASVTEDYETGLRVSALGARSQFVRATGHDGSLIVSRGLFPDSLGGAVRQKARWVLGIALAGWDRLTGLQRPSSGRKRLVAMWMEWRDRRALLAALLLFVGYLALGLGLVSGALHFAQGRPALAASALPDVTRLLLALTLALLVWRAVLRFVFTTATYGWAEGWRAVPRMVISNIVAIMASSRALLAYVPLWRGKAARWDKTAHRFPSGVEQQP